MTRTIPLIHIQHLRTEAEFRALEAEWRALLPRTAADGLFMSWEFAITWWETFASQCRLHVLTARLADGQLVGIAPFVTCREKKLPAGVFTQLCLIGELGGLAPELQDFMILPGMEQDVGRLFFEAIENDRQLHWDTIKFSFIRPDSIIVRCLPVLYDNLIVRMRAAPAPYIRLPDSWETYEESLGGHFRREVRRKVKKLQSDREIELFEPETPEEVSLAMGDLQQLNRARWGQACQSFDSAEWIRFHQAFAQKCLFNNWLSLQVLRIDGAAAAATYDFRYGGRLWKYQGGWRPEFHHLSPAIFLIAHSIKTSISDGLSVVDFLAGCVEYKIDWANESRDLWEITGFNRASARANIFQTLCGARLWTKACLQSLATLLVHQQAA